MGKTSPTPKLDAMVQAEPDLVDRIFEYLLREFPQITGLQAEGLRQAVRDEYRGEKVWVAKRPPSERQRQAQQVLALFNGRNATEVARQLRIGRATVYRILKQAGYQSSLSFSVNETPGAVGSATNPPTQGK